MMFKALISSTAALAALTAGCSPEPPPPASTDVEVSGVYISEPAMGERAAMYFTGQSCGKSPTSYTASRTPGSTSRTAEYQVPPIR